MKKIIILTTALMIMVASSVFAAGANTPKANNNNKPHLEQKDKRDNKHKTKPAHEKKAPAKQTTEKPSSSVIKIVLPSIVIK